VAWYNASWSHRKPITSQNGKVAAAYPYCLPVDLGMHFAGDTSFWDNVKPDGSDIRVTKADGTTEVARGIREVDTALEKCVMYVHHPGISTSADVDLYVYWGNAAASDYADTHQYGMQQTWGPTGFLLDHIEAFTLSFGASDLSKTHTLATQLSQLNKAFVVFSGQTGSDPSNVMKATLSKTGVTIERQAHGSEATTVKGFVVEGASGIRVRRGSVTIDTTSRIDVDVSDYVSDITKAFVLFSQEVGAGSIIDQSDLPQVYLRTSGGAPTLSVQAKTVTGFTNNIVHYQIVEMDNISVQRNIGTGSVGLAGTSASATIAAVDTAKTFLLYNGRAVNDVDRTDEWSVRGRLTSSTEVTFDRDVGDGWINLRYEVVEFTDSTSVQNVAVSMAASTATSDDTIAAVDLDHAFALTGGNLISGQGMGKSAYGADDELGESCGALELTSTTNLRTTRDKSSAAADFEAFVIEFATSGAGREDIALHYTLDTADTATGAGNVEDMSGCAVDGTFGGTLTLTDSAIGKGISLDKTNPDYITAPHSDHIAARLDELTAMAWVNPSGVSHGGSIARILTKPDNSTGDDYALGYTQQGATNLEAAFRVNTDAGQTTVNGGASSVPRNTNTLLAGSWDGSSMVLYKNGASLASGTRSGAIANSEDDLGVGAHPNDISASSDRTVDGVIDGVRIFSRALSANEILTIYNCEGDNASFWSAGATEQDGVTLVSVPSVTANATTYAPSVETGASVTVPTATANATAYPPTVSVAAVVNVPALTANAVVYAPSVETGASVTVPTVTANATAYPLDVIVQMEPIAVPTAVANATAYAPTIRITGGENSFRRDDGPAYTRIRPKIARMPARFRNV